MKPLIFLITICLISSLAASQPALFPGLVIPYENYQTLGREIGVILKPLVDSALRKNNNPEAYIKRQEELKKLFYFLGRPTKPNIPLMSQYNVQDNKWEPRCSISQHQHYAAGEKVFSLFKETYVTPQARQEILALFKKDGLATTYEEKIKKFFKDQSTLSPLSFNDKDLLTYCTNTLFCLRAIDQLENNCPERLHALFILLATVLAAEHMVTLLTEIEPTVTAEMLREKWEMEAPKKQVSLQTQRTRDIRMSIGYLINPSNS